MIGPRVHRRLRRRGKVISSLPTDHKLKAGTNTKKALQEVYNMMSWPGNALLEGWNHTRHVIILMTDGQKGPFCPTCPILSYQCVAIWSTCNARLMVGARSAAQGPNHVDLSCDPLQGGTLLKPLCDLSLPSPQPVMCCYFQPIYLP